MVTRDSNEVHRVNIATGQDDMVFSAGGQIQAVAYDETVGMIVVGMGEPGSEIWTLVNLGSGQATSLPQLDGFRLNSTAEPGSVTPGADVAAFVQETDAEGFMVRALDMHSGDVSRPVPVPFATDKNATSPPTYPIETAGDQLIGQDEGGRITVIRPSDDSVVELGVPAGLAVGKGTRLMPAISPNGECIVVNTLEGDSATSNSFIVPIAAGGQWTELDHRIVGWIEFDE